MAFQLIHEMGLYSTVFFDPNRQSRQALEDLLPGQGSQSPWPSTWPHAYGVLATLLEDSSSLGKELNSHEEKGENMWTMAAYAPVAELRKKNVGAAVKDMTEAIKTTHKTSKLLEDALKHMDGIRSIIKLVVANVKSADNLPRSKVGMAIKSWGTTWRLQVLYSLLAEVVMEESDEGFFAAHLERYSQFIGFVVEQNLQD